MRRTTVFSLTIAASLAAWTGQSPLAAEDEYIIGISAGKTGYAATIDNAWVAAVELAAEELNKSGGIMGRKVKVVSEDNKSEPQEAVKVYRKMISADGADVFVSGCVSAGNFAAAELLVRAQTPMVVCSILPQKEEHIHWAFTTIPPPRFEVETRMSYLRDGTDIRKIGVIFDASPYATLQKNIAEQIAENFGLEVVGSEQYGHSDADLSVQISKLHSAGAQAILKMGVGGTTLTAANNIKQLGLGIPLLTSLEDLAVFSPVADVLGDDFLFVASPSQVYDAVPEGELKDAIAAFLGPWRAAHGDRDPNWGGRGWDAVMLVKQAVEKAGSHEGGKVRDALEQLGSYQGTTGVYNFTPDNHQGLTENPLYLARIRGGKPEIVN